MKRYLSPLAGRGLPQVCPVEVRCRRFCVGDPIGHFFYSNEGGEPTHIHVRSGNFEAKIWLHDLTVAANAGYPAHKLGDIIRHLKMKREQLLAAWHEHFRN